MYDEYEIIRAACKLLDKYAPLIVHVDFNWALIGRLVLWNLVVFYAYMKIPYHLHRIRRQTHFIKDELNFPWFGFKAFVIVCGVGHLFFIGLCFIPNWIVFVSWYGGITALVSLAVSVFIGRKEKGIIDQINLSSRQTDFFKQIDSLIGVGRWNWDVKTGTIVWSDKLYSIYEMKPGDKIDVDYCDSLIHPEDLEKAVDHRVGMLKDRSEHEVTYRIVLNKKVKYLRALSKAERCNGKLTDFYGIIIDITSSIDENISYQKEIEGKNALLEQMAYLIRHDLKTKFGGVEYGLSVIHRQMDQKQMKSLRIDKGVKMIELGMSGIRNVVDGSIQLGNIAVKGVDMKKETFDLYPILKEHFKTVTLTGNLHISENLGEVTGNPVLIKQLFENLVSNGLKYNENNSPSVRIYRSNQEAIVIEDNGIGFPVEKFDEFLKPFHREKSEKSGQGIGLAICAAICAQHSFSMSVECEKNKFTKIIIHEKKEGIRPSIHSGG